MSLKYYLKGDLQHEMPILQKKGFKLMTSASTLRNQKKTRKLNPEIQERI